MAAACSSASPRRPMGISERRVAARYSSWSACSSSGNSGAETWTPWSRGVTRSSAAVPLGATQLTRMPRWATSLANEGGQTNLPGLGRCVGNTEAAGDSVGGYVDDGARALLNHVGQRGPTAPDGSPEAPVDLGPYLFWSIVLEGLEPDGAARNVGQHVDSAIGFHCRSHKGFGILPLGEVTQGDYARAAGLSDGGADPLGGFGYHVADYDGRPFLSQPAGRGCADALSSAGDYGHLAFKPPRTRGLGVQYFHHSALTSLTVG